MTAATDGAIREAVEQLVVAISEAVRAEAAPADAPEQLLDLATVAERLGVTRSTLYSRVLPTLRVVRVGRRVLVPSSALAEFVQGDLAARPDGR